MSLKNSCVYTTHIIATLLTVQHHNYLIEIYIHLPLNYSFVNKMYAFSYSKKITKPEGDDVGSVLASVSVDVVGVDVDDSVVGATYTYWI